MAFSGEEWGDLNRCHYGFGVPWGSSPLPSPALTLVFTLIRSLLSGKTEQLTRTLLRLRCAVGVETGSLACFDSGLDSHLGGLLS